MGIHRFKDGGEIRITDIMVAKNYFEEGEISDLNGLVVMFLDFAANLAKKGRRVSMQDWVEKLEDFLKFNEYEILHNLAKIKRTTADRFATSQYEKFKPIQDAEYKSAFDNSRYREAPRSRDRQA